MTEQHRKQIDNHGFSLVELLVAIVILAIVVVPLLHTFISSARTNMLARRRLRVTTAAQDIMEGLKADTIEELSYQFNYPYADEFGGTIPAGIKDANRFHIVSPRMVDGEIKELQSDDGVSFTDVVHGEDAASKDDVTASMYSVDQGVNYEFIGHKEGNPDDGVYYFSMEDVTMQNTNFDALIRVDARPYRGAETDPEMHNSKEVVNITNMNTKYDAFYVQSTDLVKQVLQTYNAKYSPDPEVKADDLTMTIRISVMNTVSGAKNLTKVTLTYEFTVDGAVNQPDPEVHVIYNNVESGKDLESVYLFYMPMYHKPEEYERKKDTIIYENMNNVPATFYIVKQEPASITPQLRIDESNYRCAVRIKENTGGLSDKQTQIRTNLSTSLYDAFETVATTNPEPSYFYNDIGRAKEDMEVKDLTGLKKQDRIFDIRIGIYEPGAAANGYRDEDRITELTGSKDN